MYSSRIASFFYIAVAVLLVAMTQLVSATPIEPGTTPADVISQNRNMACRMGECYIRNGTNTTDAVASANSAASSVSTPIAAPVTMTTNGAINYQPVVILPAMIAGISLLLIL